MFMIKDSHKKFLLEDGTWESRVDAKTPFRLFPEFELAQTALKQILLENGPPFAKISSLEKEYGHWRAQARKWRKKERQLTRNASVVSLKEPRALHGVKIGSEPVFKEFRVLHLIVSEHQQVIGVIGETDDPQSPFYSYVGDEYYCVFSEEKCYSAIATPSLSAEAEACL